MAQQMEELVQQCDMELMKMAMLKHEQTFRQQVHDLHRLYRVQKQLMGDLTGQRRRQQQRPRRPELSLQLPAVDDYIADSSGTGRLLTPPSRESEDELELTLAVGGGSSSRSQRKRPATGWDCSGRSPRTPSSSTDSDSDALRPVLHLHQHQHQRAAACDLRAGATVNRPQWLVQCLGLRTA